VNWELVLATDHVHTTLRNFGDISNSLLPDPLEDFHLLLRDALDLLREIGEANDRSDRSYWALPSITHHRQNRGFHDWVTLIELLRDAWLSVRLKNNIHAVRIAQGWFEVPYPCFKRLALFAASQDGCISPAQWVGWLLTDDALWLWSTDTMREVLRLLVLQGRELPAPEQHSLEQAILAGPPDDKYPEGLDPGQLQDIAAHSVWLRLAKLNASGVNLGAAAAAQLAKLSDAHPEWRLAPDERDEFAYWMTGTGDPDHAEDRVVDIAPRKRQDLVIWLQKAPAEWRPFYQDTWRDVCRTRFFHSLGALCNLAKDGVWPATRWGEALQTWSDESVALRSWQYAAPLVNTMPDAILQEIVHAVTWWIEAISKVLNRHENILLSLCRRLLELPLEAASETRNNGEPIDRPVTEAINHPVGHVTQALINFWFKQSPNDNDSLPTELAPLFTQLCDITVDRFRHGRVLLGANLIALFRVDRPWTERYLLPLFEWDRPAEASAVWEGFLWSPRLYQPLMTAFKPQFLETARHYSQLGEHRRQFAAFLTYASLGPIEDYSMDEFRSAIGALPSGGLEESAQALAQALEGAAEQCEVYWKNRVQPFWRNVWPKFLDLASPQIARSLTRLAIAARGEFPSALIAVQDWLQPIEYPHNEVTRLRVSGLCRRFPSEALKLLNAVIPATRFESPELTQCLNEISEASPALTRESSYRRLSGN
jgi:hypothetical protein